VQCTPGGEALVQPAPVTQALFRPLPHTYSFHPLPLSRALAPLHQPAGRHAGTGSQQRCEESGSLDQEGAAGRCRHLHRQPKEGRWAHESSEDVSRPVG